MDRVAGADIRTAGSDRFATAGLRITHGWRTWRPSIAIAVGSSLALALLVELLGLVFDGGPGSLWMVLSHPEHAINIWDRYDVGWYLDIATGGYAAHLHDPNQVGGFADVSAFPPLYPVAIKATAAALKIPALGAALLVNYVALVFGLTVFHRFVLCSGDAGRARRALLLLLTTPAAFFLVAPYGAGLLLGFVAASLLASRRGHWAWAGLFAALSVLTKVLAIAVAIAVLVEYMQARQWSVRRVRADVIWTLAPAIVALMGWSAYLGIAIGDPLRFMHAEADWGRGFVAPWTTLGSGIGAILTLWGRNATALVRVLEVISIVSLPPLAVVAWRRLRHGDAAFLAVSVLGILVTGLVDSAHRYLLGMPPFFVALSLVLGRRALLVVVAVSLPLSAFLLERFVTGGWAG